MLARLVDARARFRSRLDPAQQRGVRLLAWASLAVLVGLTITGVWQFVAHGPDPTWFGHVRGGGRLPAGPSEGVAELHATFGMFAGVVALFGGAWFAYKVAFDVPWTAVVAFSVCVVGLVTGSLIRFNAVKLAGRSYDDAGSGYVQILLGDVEYVVTDRWDLGAFAIRLLTLTHLLTVPVMLVAVWVALGRDER